MSQREMAFLDFYQISKNRFVLLFTRVYLTISLKTRWKGGNFFPAFLKGKLYET